jgi:hypothetical protein
LLMSTTLDRNLLPGFLFTEGEEEGGDSAVPIGGGRGVPKPFNPSDDADEDIWEGASEDLRSPQLPWLTQDTWDCARKEENVPTLVLETESIRMTLTPQYGGKIWALYDKLNKRDMVYANRAHQPANIGALKAWVAGGIEWNWSPGIIGHSASTESPVWTAVIDTALGPVIRVYEYDRYNATTWQVDMLLVDSTLFTHAKITNPGDVDLRGYWWTCVAHHTSPDSRIVTPAESAACNTDTGYTSAHDHTSSGPGSWNRFSTLNANFSFDGEGFSCLLCLMCHMCL